MEEEEEEEKEGSRERLKVEPRETLRQRSSTRKRPATEGAAELSAEERGGR